jgi:hypothetical protein
MKRRPFSSFQDSLHQDMVLHDKEAAKASFPSELQHERMQKK